MVGSADYNLLQAHRDVAALRGALAGLQSYAPIQSQSDVTSFTVTAATATQLSQTFTIRGSNANVGTTWRLGCFGFGTWGSTAQTLKLAAVFAGANIGINPTLGSSQLAASAAFAWDFKVTLMCVTTGSTGTWVCGTKGVIGQTANNVLAGTGSQGAVAWAGGSASTAGTTQDTTQDNTLQVTALWGAVTGAPTITCVGTTFERIAA